MGNLHRQNFLECAWAAGWAVEEDDGYAAVKSPVREAFANVVWAAAERGNIERSKRFFGSHRFSWALEEGQDGAALRAAGFKAPESTPELVLDLDRYSSPGHSRRIRINRADSSQDLPFWLAAASEALELDGTAARDFFQPMVRAGAVPFLALHDGLPAATALAYCGEKSLGIYAVGTRPAYRRMGLGRAVTQACLTLGQDMGQHWAVLSSSAMGLPLYRRIGFRTERIVAEFQFP